MPPLNPARWAELSPQIDELLTLPPLQRAQRLDEIAANDPRTASELRELLAAGADASRVGFMGGVADAGLAPVTPSAAAQAGWVLGAWTLVEAIGEGGMGTVWRARRSDGRFDGEAAIKLLKSGLFDAATQERFRREGALLARLRHPGIAQLLDAGVSPLGQPYLVLELVQGLRIDRWCEARGTNVRQRVELFLQVLDAVQAAHAQLAIHRDLKPSNILVDDSGRVKLLDFGIAQLLPEAHAEQAALTREGSFALTPEYAAPEQFEGGVLSVATDVYGVGVVLFELLTRSSPSGLPAGSSPMQHMRAAIEGRGRKASEASEAAVPPGRDALRGDLDNILAKALRVQPAERYASVAAFAADLRAHLQYRPVSARRDAWSYRLSRYLRRNRVAVAAAGLALLAILAGVTGTLTQAARATEQAALARLQETQARASAAESERQRGLAERDRATAASEAARAERETVRAGREAERAGVAAREAQQQSLRADTEAATARRTAEQARQERDRALTRLMRAEATNDFTGFLLDEASPAGKPLTQGELLQRAEGLAEQRFARDTPLRVHLQLLLSERYDANQNYERAHALIARAYADSRSTQDVSLRAKAGCALARLESERGDRERARQLLAEAYAELAPHDEESDTLGYCLTLEAVLVRRAGDLPRAIAVAERAVAAQTARPGPPGRELDALSILRSAYDEGGRLADAIVVNQRLQAALAASGTERSRNASFLASNWALSRQGAGQMLEAVQMSELAASIQRELDPDRGASAATLMTLANGLTLVGRHKDAIAAADEGVLKARETSMVHRLQSALSVVTIVHARAGSLEAARRAHAEYMALAEANKPAPAPRVLAYGRRDGAQVLLSEGEADRAATMGCQANEVLVGLAVPYREQVEGWLRCAQALNLAGRHAEAVHVAMQAEAAVLPRMSGLKHSSQLGRARAEKGLALLVSEREAALRLLREALVHLDATLGPLAPETLAARRALQGNGG